MPRIKRRVPDEKGAYLLQTNAAGFRSNREFVAERHEGMFRVLLFGDSQTAGNYLSNRERYSDRLEAAVPGLEIYNYGLTGSGTDQHYLVFKEFGNVERDLIVIAIYIENICRITSRVLGFRTPKGDEVFFEKPYFEIEGDELIVRNIPVSKQYWTPETLPPHLNAYVYRFGDANLLPTKGAFARKAVRFAHLLPLGETARDGLKTMLAQVLSWLNRNPIPHYEKTQNENWLLLKRILQEWKRKSDVPVLIMPIPTDLCLREKSYARAYQRRFREFCDTEGCMFFDPLPEFLKYEKETRNTFFSNRNGHLTPQGHEALAQLLAPVITRQMSKRAAN